MMVPMQTPNPKLRGQLVRIRWAVRAVLLLGVAASVVANVLHAQPNPIAQTIAAWPPLALLLTVELISRVPVHRRSLAAVRLVATAAIASIAAWVSYWHMAGVASRFGEDAISAHLLPVSVDGLVVVASISLVELAGRIRAIEDGVAAPAPAVLPAVPARAAVPPQGPPADPVPALVTPVAPAAQVPPEGPPAEPARNGRVRRPRAETTRLVRALQAGDPGITREQIATALGVTARHLRKVLAASASTGPAR